MTAPASTGARLRHLVRAVAAAIRRVVGPVLNAVLIGALWVLLVGLPWCFDRIVRFDPLRQPGPGGAGWIPRHDGDDRPDRLWFDDPARRRVGFWGRWHRRAPAILAVVVVAAGLVAVAYQKGHERAAPANEAERLVRAEPWFTSVDLAQNAAYKEVHFSQFVGVELGDHASKDLNIRDGRRVTWQPPCRGGRALTVWVFGGSTVFGVLQPDDRTIPSELAKVAARHGVTLRVENFGVPGEVSWQSAHRLERALAGAQRPDLAVMYDGFNDLAKTTSMDFARRGGPTDFVGGTDAVGERILTNLNAVDTGQWRLVRGPKSTATLTSAEALDLAVAQYGVADHTARLLATDRAIPLLHLYQPSAWTRSKPVAGEASDSPEALARAAAFRRRLPPEVVDLGDALDAHPEPLYYDAVHTLTKANPWIAERIFREAEPTLTRLRDEGKGHPC